MLPFLKPKQAASVIIARRKENGSLEPMNEEGKPAPEMSRIAEQMVSGIHNKDSDAVAEALRMAHEHLAPVKKEE